MAMMEGFELYSEGDRSDIFITLRNTTITFSKAAIEVLEYAEYVHMFLDKKGCRVAFQPCEQDSAAMRFFTQPEEGKQAFVRIANKKRAEAIMGLAGLENCGKGIRFYGKYYGDESLLVFELVQEG